MNFIKRRKGLYEVHIIECKIGEYVWGKYFLSWKA